MLNKIHIINEIKVKTVSIHRANTDLKKPTEPCSSNFQFYFNFYYHLMLFPFKLKWNSHLKIFELVTNRVQQVTSGVICTVIIFITLLWIHGNLFPSESDKKSYYDLSAAAAKIGGQLQVLNIIQMVWGHQSDIISFITSFQKHQIFKTNVQIKFLIIISFYMTYIMLFAYGNRSYIKTFLNGATANTEQQSRDTLSSFFILYPSDQNKTLNNDFILLYVLVDIFLDCLAIVLDAFLLLVMFSLNKIADGLHRKIRDENSTELILQEYENIRELVGTTNKLIGKSILVNYLAVLIFYANTLNVVFTNVGDTSMFLLTNVPFALCNAITWRSAAQFHRTVGDVMKNWIYSKRSKIELSNQHLTILLSDINSNSIGVDCGYFMITYRFLGSMIGLIFTYSIIMFQFKSV